MSLSLQGITKSFGNEVVLDHLDLHVAQKELLVLLGPSGSGKTTTLNIICGIERQDSGDVCFSDRLMNDLPPDKRPFGLVFQDFVLFPHLTVFDNVAFGLKARRKKGDIEGRVVEALKLLEIEPLRGRYPKSLSGGEQQRVALARALVLEPELLLLDEPLSNLDARLRENMRMDIKRLQRKLGITTLFVTHDHTEAIIMGDRVAILHDRKIEQIGEPGEIFFKPKTEFVASFVGAENRFRGHVSEVDADGNMVTIASSDLEIVASLDEAVSVGEHVCVFIRPDDINVIAKPSRRMRNLFKGNIEDMYLTGSFVRLIVAVKGHHFISAVTRQAASDLGLSNGKDVFVTFRPSAVKCLKRPFCQCPEPKE
jgi:ABC-type Fe3+/spermidine/putrescine transport system ATPase subunit